MAREIKHFNLINVLLFNFYQCVEYGHFEFQLLTNFRSFSMTFRENDEKNLAHTVFTQYINEQENQMEAELAFDASFFKANRKVICALYLISVLFHIRNSLHTLAWTPRVSHASRNKYVLIKS